MLKKISIFFILISISLTIVLILDKNSEEIISDSARVLIGLSNKDSMQCNACSIDGKYFENGCKHCEQDGIYFHIYTSQNSPYSTGWGNDKGLYLGDENCSGQTNFKNLKAKSGDTYGIEIKRNGLQFETKLYEDELFSKILESTSVTMCSEPTELKYFRISTEDGHPTGNGGKILGFIDQITLMERDEIIFEESFDSCLDKTCSNKWIINNPDRIYIDAINKNLFFNSEVSGTNDNIHYDLGQKISDESWTLRFVLHLDELEEYPKNAGFLPLDKISRFMIFWIPIILLPLFSIIFLKNKQNKFTKSILICNFSLILTAIIITIF